MYLLIRYAGVVVEAVALAISKNRLRVIVPGIGDTLELKRCSQNWTWAGTENQPVELEFISPLAQDAPIARVPAMVFANAN